jgi:hypothetical protein
MRMTELDLILKQLIELQAYDLTSWTEEKAGARDINEVKTKKRSEHIAGRT